MTLNFFFVISNSLLIRNFSIFFSDSNFFTSCSISAKQCSQLQSIKKIWYRDNFMIWHSRQFSIILYCLLMRRRHISQKSSSIMEKRNVNKYETIVLIIYCPWSSCSPSREAPNGEWVDNNAILCNISMMKLILLPSFDFTLTIKLI